MKLITYEYDGKERVGILSDDGESVFATEWNSMNELIESGKTPEKGGELKAADVKILAPIPMPRQDVICLGINYAEHREESARYKGDAFDMSSEDYTIYFSKRVNRAVAPGEDVPAHADIEEKLDYEAELAVVIGKEAKDVSVEDAWDHIFGYTILNDVSARDLQTNHKQWYFGKSLDGFTPIGPCIATEDEFERPPALKITSKINGELRQNSNTDMLIKSIPQVIAELSAGMTLLPGTIIATGTPSGVGLGFTPPKFMKKGDVMTLEIEGIGVLENAVV